VNQPSCCGLRRPGLFFVPKIPFPLPLSFTNNSNYPSSRSWGHARAGIMVAALSLGISSQPLFSYDGSTGLPLGPPAYFPQYLTFLKCYHSSHPPPNPRKGRLPPHPPEEFPVSKTCSPFFFSPRPSSHPRHSSLPTFPPSINNPSPPTSPSAVTFLF